MRLILVACLFFGACHRKPGKQLLRPTLLRRYSERNIELTFDTLRNAWFDFTKS